MLRYIFVLTFFMPRVLPIFFLFTACSKISQAPLSSSSGKQLVDSCFVTNLDISGLWARQSNLFFGTADTLRIIHIENSSYEYSLTSHYAPTAEDEIRLTDLPPNPLISEENGRMGLYHIADKGWAIDYTVTSTRHWNGMRKEYTREWELSIPYWEVQIRMLDDWLCIGWDWYDETFDSYAKNPNSYEENGGCYPYRRVGAPAFSLRFDEQ